MKKSPEFQAKNEEEKRKILKLVNQSIEAMGNIEVELNHQGEQIDNVNNNVEKAKSDVEEGNYKHLEEAAKSAVKSRGIKYTRGNGTYSWNNWNYCSWNRKCCWSNFGRNNWLWDT